MLCCFPRESTPCERVREAGVEKRSWKKDEESTRYGFGSHDRESH